MTIKDLLGKGGPNASTSSQAWKAPLGQSLQRLREKEDQSLQRLRAKESQRLQMRKEKEKESLERLMKAPGEELLGTQGEEPTKGLMHWVA